MKTKSADATASVTAESCPHSCDHCRSIELGYGGRPLTVRELLRHGLVTFPSREGRVVWSDETVAARRDDDRARGEFEAARSAWISAQVDFEEIERKHPEHTAEHVRRRMEAQSVLTAAELELDRAEERYQAAAGRMMALERRDSERHRLDDMRAMYERAEAEKRERAAKQSSRRRLLLGRLIG